MIPILILILTIWAYVWLKNHDTEWQEEQIAMKKCLETAVDKNNCSKN